MEQGDTSNSNTHTYVLASGPLGNITWRSDLLTTARIACGIPEMRQAIQEDRSLPFGSACVLHSKQPQEYSANRNSQGIDASLMPLDSPTAGAFVPCRVIGRDNKHWAGANGEWVAFVQEQARWSLLNVYTKEEIALPSIRNVGIHPDDHFRYHCEMARIELLKIQITGAPYMVGGRWHYYAIAVFDKVIAIMLGGTDSDWRILKNDFLRPSIYADAILDEGRIYAVTEPRGDVLVWEPLEYGARAAPRVIPSPVNEDVANFQAGGQDSRNWFLATGLGGNIIWIRIRGHGESAGVPTKYMGRELLKCPSLSCDVFVRDGQVGDPVDPVWIRQEDLQGSSLFLGVNYPFLLNAPEAAAGNAGDTVPLFKPDCVFSSHNCVNHNLRFPDWCRIPVNGGVSIGSSLVQAELNWGEFHEAPMWFVPTLPEPEM